MLDPLSAVLESLLHTDSGLHEAVEWLALEGVVTSFMECFAATKAADSGCGSGSGDGGGSWNGTSVEGGGKLRGAVRQRVGLVVGTGEGFGGYQCCLLLGWHLRCPSDGLKVR